MELVIELVLAAAFAVEILACDFCFCSDWTGVVASALLCILSLWLVLMIVVSTVLMVVVAEEEVGGALGIVFGLDDWVMALEELVEIMEAVRCGLSLIIAA